MISPLNCWAMAMPREVLPEAVGPMMAMRGREVLARQFWRC